MAGGSRSKAGPGHWAPAKPRRIAGRKGNQRPPAGVRGAVEGQSSGEEMGSPRHSRRKEAAGAGRGVRHHPVQMNGRPMGRGEWFPAAPRLAKLPEGLPAPQHSSPLS